MTPAQLDHLNRIKRHLETLLANAEKRTPGEWTRPGWQDCVDMGDDEKDICIGHTSNAAFIASCAGNAEAGWRSTLAAIAAFSFQATCDSYSAQEDAEALMLEILAAWPIESLKL